MGFDFVLIAPILLSHCGFSFVFGCGVSFLVSSGVFLSIVQHLVVIPVLSQEGVRACSSTLPSWTNLHQFYFKKKKSGWAGELPHRVERSIRVDQVVSVILREVLRDSSLWQKNHSTQIEGMLLSTSCHSLLMKWQEPLPGHPSYPNSTSPREEFQTLGLQPPG